MKAKTTATYKGQKIEHIGNDLCINDEPVSFIGSGKRTKKALIDIVKKWNLL